MNFHKVISISTLLIQATILYPLISIPKTSNTTLPSFIHVSKNKIINTTCIKNITHTTPDQYTVYFLDTAYNPQRIYSNPYKKYNNPFIACRNNNSEAYDAIDNYIKKLK